MPTCGPLLCVMMTRASSLIKSATAWAVRSVAAFCSGSVVPRASWPRAITIFLFFIFLLLGGQAPLNFYKLFLNFCLGGQAPIDGLDSVCD